MGKSYQNTLPQNAVGMADMVTADLFHEKMIQNARSQNAVGMTDFVTAEFIPWKIISKYATTKCRRHDRYGNRGIHYVEKSYQNTLPQNAVGMADMLTAEFIP